MGGLYDILESYRFQDPKYTYEGLYQDPMSKLATANPLKAIFNPDFEYRSPSFIERFAKEGATNLQGYVPIDYDRAVDFKRLFEDRPLKPTDGVKRFEGFDPRVGTITPFQPYENPTYQMKQQLGMVPTGIMTQAPLKNLGFDTTFGVANEPDVGVEEKKRSGLAGLFRALLGFAIPGSSLLLGGGMGSKALEGIKSLLDFSDSPRYRPATIGVGGYTPEELNKMNALGGYYSEPMRAYRRSAAGLSNMLRRAAANKSYSDRRLKERFKQFGLDPNTSDDMISSIRESSKTGYGGYGSRSAAKAAAASGGRDYSRSPGAMAGDMEYGEE